MNYAKDATAVRKHLDNTVNTQTYRMADMAHLGGAATFVAYLDTMHQGEARAIKKELKHVLDYLFYYEMTKNPLYYRFAEDALMHVQTLCDDIQDTEEKKIAYKFVEAAHAALMKLTNKDAGDMEGDGTITMPETARTSYFGGE